MPGGWRTDKQAAFLRAHGLNDNVSFDQASAMIDQVKGSGGGGRPSTPGGCTPKQSALLARHGYPTNVSFDTASQIIEQLKANGWKRPDDAVQQPYATAAQQYAPTPQPPQYVPPAPTYAPHPPQTPYPTSMVPPPQFQNGTAATWGGQPQFDGVPSFG